MPSIFSYLQQAVPGVATAAGPVVTYHQVLPFNAAGGLCVDTAGSITHSANGLPYTAAGLLATTVAAPAYYNNGIGFNAGRVIVPFA
jgi:hypothetical protein